MRHSEIKSPVAFTLIELLVVISIIGLLVGILVPVVQTAKKYAEKAKTLNRVSELGAACEAYNKEHNYYPGQADPTELKGDGGQFTGSQYLAIALGNDGYAEFLSSDLLQPPQAPVSDTISDRTGDPMAILYYPARLGFSGLGQYKYNDNSLYTTRSTETAQDFDKFITDNRYSSVTRPYNDQKFLIIAAGTTRRYFETDKVTFPSF